MTVTNIWLGGKIYGGEIAKELKDKVDKVIITFWGTLNLVLGSFESTL